VAKPDPVDTTGDPVLEAKWQALVDEVIAAKAAAMAAREACILAEQERGAPDQATPAALAKVAETHDAYRAAGERVKRASEAMKAGEL
jgi:hypothetical protein